MIATDDMPPDDVFKNTARMIYETAEWGPKREWEAMPESAKLTWYIAAKRAYIAAAEVVRVQRALEQSADAPTGEPKC